MSLATKYTTNVWRVFILPLKVRHGLGCDDCKNSHPESFEFKLIKDLEGAIESFVCCMCKEDVDVNQ